MLSFFHPFMQHLKLRPYGAISNLFIIIIIIIIINAYFQLLFSAVYALKVEFSVLNLRPRLYSDLY